MQKGTSEKVSEILCDCLGLNSIDMNSNLDHLGTESIDYMDLNFRLEKVFQKKIEISYKTGQDIVDFLEKN
ncbi:MAG: acyl carrier protein [Neisseriaceae bacterium]|nr:MAG: acyl carrier protein [Neisseriaceae bacterium]